MTVRDSLKLDLALREWVTKRDHRPERPLTETTPLFLDRRLTSLDLPELILLVERLAERTVRIDEINGDYFADLTTIADRFWR